MQNPVLWDECCKRAECQPGCGCPTGSYHEEDGTMCWQVLDPRWDCPHQWSCQLRHGRRTREEQMCVLKWWGKSVEVESHFRGQQCTAVSKTGPHTVSAGQHRWKMHCDSLRVEHTHTRVFRFQHACVFKGEICNMNVFSIYVLYLSVQSCFPFECGHNAFQFIHMCFINYYDTGVWGNFLLWCTFQKANFRDQNTILKKKIRYKLRNKLTI